MKSPQGRESKKPKKPKGKAAPKVFEDPTRKAFHVPQSENAKGSDKS
jgi:hypothetical protein